MTDLPDHVLIFLLFIVGACFGSFLNVVIYRVPKKMSLIKPGSHCTSCNNALKPYDNIPILSFFIFKINHLRLFISSIVFILLDKTLSLIPVSYTHLTLPTTPYV